MKEEKQRDAKSTDCPKEKKHKKHGQKKSRSKSKKRRRRSQVDEIKQIEQLDLDYEVTQPTCQRETTEEKSNDKSIETFDQTPKNNAGIQKATTKKFQMVGIKQKDQNDMLQGQQTNTFDLQLYYTFKNYVRPCDTDTDKLRSTLSKSKSSFFIKNVLTSSQEEPDEQEQDEIGQYDEQGKPIKKVKTIIRFTHIFRTR